jgi:hypothetical protein
VAWAGGVHHDFRDFGPTRLKERSVASDGARRPGAAPRRPGLGARFG